MTIVTFLAKGAVTSPTPKLVQKPRELSDFFDRTPALVWTAYGECTLALGLLAALVWRVGRDRHYVSMHYLTNDTTEERLPLFKGDPIVVEFEPPEKIRPAQMGLLVDERADTLDVTATIIDLAVRGYLKITELPEAAGSATWTGSSTSSSRPMPRSSTTSASSSRTLCRGHKDDDDVVARTSFTTISTQAKNALYADARHARMVSATIRHDRGYARAGGSSWRLEVSA